MRPILFIMRPQPFILTSYESRPEFSTFHYFSFGGPSLQLFFMRPPCFYHMVFVIHYEDPHHLFLTSYEDEAPLNLALVTISLSEAPAFYHFL